MKRNPKHDEIELLKAVAQAWYGHSGSSKAADAAATSEFDAHRMYFKGKPSRFKLEAMTKPATNKRDDHRSWDFKQSLWDSYEIISVSKKLERGLAMDDPFSGGGAAVRRKESKNSLRNLFNKMSSRRFSEVD